jgi:suppressor of G2 allele of SKP1
MPSGSDYSLELDPLAQHIVPGESLYKVLSTKIEIKLKKKVAGIMWGALESENDMGTQSKYYIYTTIITHAYIISSGFF